MPLRRLITAFRDAMTFEEFEQRASEMFDEIPAEMRHNVEYLVVAEEALPHPTIPDVYTLGECATGGLDVGMAAPVSVRSGGRLSSGSFAKRAELDEGVDGEEELWETIPHEIRPHREST